MRLPSIGEKGPVLIGERYCSSRCGCGCTKAAYDLAVKEGEALVKRLGPKWKAMIWENSGWNYKAVCGVFEIYPHCSGSRLTPSWTVHGYCAWIQTQPQFISGKHPDPFDAMREALNKMQSLFDTVSATLTEARNLHPVAIEEVRE